MEGAAPALPVNEFLISAQHRTRRWRYADGERDSAADDTQPLLRGLLELRVLVAYEDVWRPEVRRLTLIRLYAVIKRAREAGL